LYFILAFHQMAYYKPMAVGLEMNPEDTFTTCEELKTIVFNYAELSNAYDGYKIKDPLERVLARIECNTIPKPLLIKRLLDDPEWYDNKCGIRDAKINRILANLPWRQ
jgi:hypothetical protein